MISKIVKAALVLLLGFQIAALAAAEKPEKPKPAKSGSVKNLPLSFRSLPAGCYQQVTCAMGSAEKNRLEALVQAMRNSLYRGYTSIKVVSIESNKHCCTLVYSCVNT